MLGQHLDGDGAVQAGVGGLVELSHAPGAKRGLGEPGLLRLTRNGNAATTSSSSMVPIPAETEVVTAVDDG